MWDAQTDGANQVSISLLRLSSKTLCEVLRGTVRLEKIRAPDPYLATPAQVLLLGDAMSICAGMRIWSKDGTTANNRMPAQAIFPEVTKVALRTGHLPRASGSLGSPEHLGY